MELIVSAIQSIPEVIWTAVLGSVLTLAGVVLNNRHHREEQKAQREHDSAECDRQRKFDTRAEVYLRAAAEMSHAQQHLGNLVNLDLAKTNAGEALSELLASTNQAVLIATDETAAAINHFLSAYMTAFFKLLPKLLPIQNARSDRDIENSTYEIHNSEVQRIVATMTHLNETNAHDQANWDALERNFTFNQERAREAAENRSEAWERINRFTLEYMDAIVEEVQEITWATLPALVAIRKDLEISSNIDAYRVQYEDRLRLMETLIVEFKEEVEKADN